jgi:hypothetical protein
MGAFFLFETQLQKRMNRCVATEEGPCVLFVRVIQSIVSASFRDDMDYAAI